MSRKVQCERCGGEDFRLESGFYFCSECQLQSQDIQEHVLDAFYGGTAIQTRKLKITEEEKESRAQSGPTGGKKQVSSVELFNYVLKGLVDELIRLGAPKKLKIITLQLWASYLQRIEMAFTSTSVQKKPKLGMWHRQGDVARFYKVRKPMSIKNYPQLLRKRKKAKSKKTSSVASSDGGSKSYRSKKRKLSAKKASLAQAEYNESRTEGSVDLSSYAPSLSSPDGSQSSFSGSETIMYTKKGREDLRDFLEQINEHGDKLKVHNKMVKRCKRRVHYTRPTHIVAILRIALILSDSNIHISDLLRWSEEGHLSYYRMRNLIPPEIILAPDQRVLFKYPPFDISIICWCTTQMVALLSVKNVGPSSLKLISNLVKRYCEILNLPDNVSIGIDKLLELKPPKVWLDSYRSNLEGRAMALILFSLKILIGLDDVTEYSYVPRKDLEGLNWKDWCCQYESRMAKKAAQHYPTLAGQYPNSYVGRNHSFLSHWTTLTDPGLKVYPTKSERSMMESFTRVLESLVCQLPKPSSPPGTDHEVKSSGPKLAVLGECIDGSVGKEKRCYVLEPSMTKSEIIELRKKDALDLKVRLSNDEAKCKIERASTGVKKVNVTEDHSVWMYHTDELSGSKIEHNRFVYVTAGKLPHSFCWLLNQVADLVHQPPQSIYRELIRVEKVYSNTKNFVGKW